MLARVGTRASTCSKHVLAEMLAHMDLATPKVILKIVIEVSMVVEFTLLDYVYMVVEVSKTKGVNKTTVAN